MATPMLSTISVPAKFCMMTRDSAGQRFDEFREITSNQDDVGALSSDIGARSHRNSNVRLHQCRRIVDTVPQHRNLRILSAKLGDPLRLLIGQQLSHGFVDADRVPLA
jgi:hypothetical protein